MQFRLSRRLFAVLSACLLTVGLCAVLAAGASARGTHHHGGDGGFGHHHHGGGGLNIISSPFGNLPTGVPNIPRGRRGHAVTRCRTRTGMTVSILDYGGIIQSLYVPDRRGHDDNVTLGFGNIDGYTNAAYLKSNPYFGAIIGRYGNRIANGTFTLDGTPYSVDINNRRQQPPRWLHRLRQGDVVRHRDPPGQRNGRPDADGLKVRTSFRQGRRGLQRRA